MGAGAGMNGPDYLTQRAAGALAAQRAIGAAREARDADVIPRAFVMLAAQYGQHTPAALAFVAELAKRVTE